MNSPETVSKFPLGKIAVTSGVLGKISMDVVVKALARHAQGDWGILTPDEQRMNDEWLKNGGTLASIYQDPTGGKFYILTEPDRTRTTILLPVEY